MKKSFIVCTAVLLLAQVAKGQSLSYKIESNEVKDMKNLQVKVFADFFIAPGKRELTLPANLTAEARYWAGSLLDVRAGFSMGSNKGLLFGGTLHLRDHYRNVKERFILSRETRGRYTTTKFIKVPVEVRSISGPALDVFVGSQMGVFTTKIDAGWEWQGYRRARIETDEQYISGAGNGYHSFKLQAVMQGPIPTQESYFNQEGRFIIDKYNTMGIGGQLSFDYHFRPWRFSTFYGGVTGGYIKVAGEGSAPIISVRVGLVLAQRLSLFSLNKKS